jgi:hypothetical protein
MKLLDHACDGLLQPSQYCLYAERVGPDNATEVQRVPLRDCTDGAYELWTQGGTAAGRQVCTYLTVTQAGEWKLYRVTLKLHQHFSHLSWHVSRVVSACQE